VTGVSNLDAATVRDFGREWESFDQQGLPEEEADELFHRYFATFPWDQLPPDAEGADVGCGTGRWAAKVAPRVGSLHCIDASTQALQIAAGLAGHLENCTLHRASVDALPVADGSLDFCYSLGVLHHVPDLEAGLRSCVATLKPGAPFLVYLYYALDGRPWWFRRLWSVTDAARRVVSRLPHAVKLPLTTAVAASVYWPLARAARVAARRGHRIDAWPLGFYADRSFYVMRTDALDRFGTRLEQRVTRSEMAAMLERAGLVDVCFGDEPPYWCATGRRAAP